MSLLIPFALCLLSIPLVLALIRANEIACLKVRDGRVRVARGSLPPRLVHDLSDILANPPAAARLRVVIEDKKPRVYAQGELSAQQQQRIKNVVGLWPLAKLRYR
jgi:hypothetical protein